MTALTPGIYKATVRGVPDQIVMVSDQSVNYRNSTLTRCGPEYWHPDSEVTDARPLTLVDVNYWFHGRIPEAAKHVRESSIRNTASREVICDILDQIEAQTKPARIPEPGLWGVVEDIHFRYVRYSMVGGDDWANLLGHQYTWASLIDPTLVRPGIETAA